MPAGLLPNNELPVLAKSPEAGADEVGVEAVFVACWLFPPKSPLPPLGVVAALPPNKDEAGLSAGLAAFPNKPVPVLVPVVAEFPEPKRPPLAGVAAPADGVAADLFWPKIPPAAGVELATPKRPEPPE